MQQSSRSCQLCEDALPFTKVGPLAHPAAGGCCCSYLVLVLQLGHEIALAAAAQGSVEPVALLAESCAMVALLLLWVMQQRFATAQDGCQQYDADH
jgi:hypothetical protein